MVVWRRISPDDAAKLRAIDVERRAMDWTWVGALGLRNGEPIIEDEPRQVRLTVAGDHYTMERGDKIDKGSSVIDPTSIPKTIDLEITDGESKGQRWVGIYEVAGYVHRACFAPAGKPRPTRFASEAGSDHILWVFARPAPNSGRTP
jgi:uncharacterized protein (TIGR03067 family)